MRLRSLKLAASVAAAVMVAVSCSGDAPTAPGSMRAPSLGASLNGSTILVSQVYGGGGNVGSNYRNDFIELHNNSNAAVSVAGWSVQYASATGTTWQVTALTGSIPAGGYYLVQESQGTGGVTNLPSPDAAGTIAMSATAGKVALVMGSSVALTGACPAGATIGDLVSFGTTASDCGLGRTPAPSNSNAVLRGNNGCTDTGSLAADFAAGLPTPRNSATTAYLCNAPPPATVASVVVTPNPANVVVGATVSFTATAYDNQSTPQPISGVAFTWSSDNTAAATVTSSGAATGVATGTANIRAAAPNGVFGEAALTVDPVPPPPVTVPVVRFSELHYDNIGGDVLEAIEIEAPDAQDLAGWSIVLYNGNGGVDYNTMPLSGVITGTGTGTCSGRGVLTFNYPDNTIQNGAPDGMALVDNLGAVVEFLSWEGSFTATAGVASGKTSVDIGVLESSSPIGHSLQRNNAGTAWTGPSTYSFGFCNGTGNPPPPGNTVSISINNPAQAPAGYVKPAFATVKDVGGATITPTLTWTSSDPAVASVDQLGYISALVPGTVTITATEPGGASGTASFTVLPTTIPTNAVYNNNTMFGVPTDGTPADDILLSRSQYAFSYSATRGAPNWVAANINVTVFGAAPRCDCFSPDPLLPSGVYRVVDFDYRNSGYDRGHMTQSEPRTDTYQENATTFFLTNIVPQAGENNQGPWGQFENYLNDLVRLQGKEVWTYMGGEYAASPTSLKNEGKVLIPDYTWKVAVILNAGQTINDIHTTSDLQVIAVRMPNLTTAGGPASAVGIRNVPWQTYVTTVDQIEARMGYDVLAALPDQVEIAVESNTRAPVAAVNGPFASAEGSSVPMSAAGSSDPDGDALTFAWTFGDGGTATGTTVSHTYAQNGVYTVSVTATDIRGLENTATTTVTVSNVAPQISAIAGATLLPGETYSAGGSFTDPGADSWTATVNYGDGTGTAVLGLSGMSFSLSHTYTAPGTFTVTVGVADGDDQSNATATVTVLTLGQGLDLARAMVLQLAADGIINNGNANSLRAKIDAAAASLARDNTGAALNQLRALLNELDAMVASNRLTAAEADPIRQMVGRVIDAAE